MTVDMIRLRMFHEVAKSGKIMEYMNSCFGSFYRAHRELFVGNVVDIGCGRGTRHSIGLDRATYIGLDLSLSELAQNRQTDLKVCGNAVSLPLKNASISLIICNDLIEHLPSPDRFLKEAGRILTPGGTLLMGTPSLYGYTTVIARLLPRALAEFVWRVWKNSRMPDYPFVYKANTNRAIRRLALSSGFTVESIVYINQVTHWIYAMPGLATMIYAYGKLASRIGMDFLLNYMMIALRKRP